MKEKTKEQTKEQLVRIFTDGSGKSLGGGVSGFAWLREDTGKYHVESIPDLTNNEAEYHGVISALKPLHPGTQVEVLTDSLLVVSQLRGEYRTLDPKLAKLAAEVRTIVEQKQLVFTLKWIPRRDNRAGKLL